MQRLWKLRKGLEMLYKKANIQTAGSESATGLHSTVDAGSLPHFELR